MQLEQLEQAKIINSLLDDVENRLSRTVNRGMSRRNMLKVTAATGFLTFFNPLKAISSLVVKKEKLYDLQLAIYSNPNNTKKGLEIFKNKLKGSELEDYACIYQGSKQQVILKLNTPSFFVKIIRNRIKKQGIDSMIIPSLKFYTSVDYRTITTEEKNLFENYSVIPLIQKPAIFGDRILETVITYMTEYTSKDIPLWRDKLVKSQRKYYLRIPSSHIKPFFRRADELNKDFYIVLMGGNPSSMSLNGIALNYCTSDVESAISDKASSFSS